MNTGPLFIALAALLWATDSIFRVAAVRALDPTFVVAVEHLVCTLILLPYMLLRHRKELTALKAPQWLGLCVIGAGGSALATILFTASFRYVNPSVAILLQKLQPIVVVLLAVAFLKERPAQRFFGWAALALVSAVVLSFPDFDFGFISRGLDPHSRGVVYAIGAAAIWGLSTVVGKAMLDKVPPTVVTFWRYIFGLGMMIALVTAAGVAIPVGSLLIEPVGLSLLYMSLGPGLLALLFYYNGLIRTPASVATLVELIFPVGAVILNAIFLHAPLNPIQVLAGGVLLFAVSRASASQ